MLSSALRRDLSPRAVRQETGSQDRGELAEPEAPATGAVWRGLTPGVLQLDTGRAWTLAVALPVGFKILLKKIICIIYIIKDNLEIKTY